MLNYVTTFVSIDTTETVNDVLKEEESWNKS